MSANALASTSIKDKTQNTKLLEYAEKELIKAYSEKNKAMLPVLQNMFGL
jgi:hypothetical protein